MSEIKIPDPTGLLKAAAKLDPKKVKAHMDRINDVVARCAAEGHYVLCEEHAKEVRDGASGWVVAFLLLFLFILFSFKSWIVWRRDWKAEEAADKRLRDLAPLPDDWRLPRG